MWKFGSCSLDRGTDEEIVVPVVPFQYEKENGHASDFRQIQKNKAIHSLIEMKGVLA
ncbi:hypothetical protein [Pueribacillus theae]|uniref:hypothetical protein n=1 Tax=Pueribacillus theae TaxID=2171751 RepID=UPI00140349AE|nr:hypothetical protein [Pueribacillus theae]